MHAPLPRSSALAETRPDRWGPLLCGTAMATVGTSVVASKLIGVQLEPFAATALRHALALPLLALLCAITRPAWQRPRRRDALILLLQAAAGSVGYTVLLIAGTAMSSASDAAVVAGALPAMATLFAILMLGERPGMLALVGIALATAGVLLLALGGGPALAEPRPQRALGIAMVIAAVACEVIFILGQRRLSVPIAPLTMATLMSAGGLLLSLPAATLVRALVDGPGQTGVPATPDLRIAVAAVAWYAWVPTVAGFWLWYAGARRATATQAAASTAWLPLVAFAGATAVLGETPTSVQLTALALVMAGILLGSLTRPRHR